MSTLPFVVGQWVRGEDFYGRRELLAEILHGDRDRLWLLGTRRIGKTSLLRQLEHLTREQEGGFFPLFWDFQGAESPEELSFELGDALLDAEDRLGSLGIRLDEVAGSGLPGSGLPAEDLFAGLELLRRELRSRGLRLLLLCDEVEELLSLRQKDPGFLRQLRRTLAGDGIRSVLASAVRLWDLATPAEDFSFLDGFTPPLHLRPLAAAEARALIRQDHLTAASRPGFDQRSVERIRRACGDHPHLIQLVAKRTLELEDLEAALEEVAADPMARYFFATDFEMLSADERRVLRRVARQATATATKPVERLASLGYLCRDEGGGWTVANAFFRRWLREVPSSGPGAAKPPPAGEKMGAESTLAGFPLGTTVDGRYRLREQIGEGASAVVFAADDTLLETRVAIKLLKEEVTATPALRERVRREILLARDIGHPSILRIYDLGTTGGRFYLTMEWVDGPTLAERIAAEAPFPRRSILAIGAELAAALEAAHGRRVLHRDIKPQNVLMAGDRPLLTDFGLARALGKPGITGLGVFLGTPNYVSPEQASLDPLDERSDLYSLGLVLFEMATGRRPFAGASMAEVLEMHRRQPAPDPRSMTPTADADLSAVILRCLEKDRSARFASARALRQALERLMTAEDRRSETSAILSRSPESLLPLVYDELRQRARGFLARERRDHTLQPTALVHEAYLRLVDQTRVDWQGRTHFLAVGAQAMRRLLIDYARGHGRAKRGGEVRRVSLDESAWGVAGPSLDFDELLSVDQALAELRRVSERQATIVELRFFSGLKVQEIADHLGLSRRTVQSEWARAKAWLEDRLGAGR